MQSCVKCHKPRAAADFKLKDDGTRCKVCEGCIIDEQSAPTSKTPKKCLFTRKRKTPDAKYESEIYYEPPQTRTNNLKYIFSPSSTEKTPNESKKKKKKKLRSQDAGNAITFKDVEDSSIEFRVDSNGFIDEYCDGVLVSKNLTVLTINLYLLCIEDDEEMIYLKRNDCVKVFTWFKTIDTLCHVKYTCLNEHGMSQRIPPQFEFFIEEEMKYQIIKCLKCAHIRSSPILCKAPFCVTCVPSHGHHFWISLPSKFDKQELYSPMSVRCRAPDRNYNSQPLLEERAKTSVPVRIIVPGHPLWKKKVESLKYEISAMNETDIMKELKVSSSSVGMADTKASKMIALLSHRKATMDLRYEAPLLDYFQSQK